MGATFGNSPSLHRPQVAIHAISTLLLIWMYVGGLVSYAPSVDSSEIQNIYLSRMLWYGISIAVLQVVGIFLSLQTKEHYKYLLPEQPPNENTHVN